MAWVENFDPYCHEVVCEKCNQVKMCVQGVRIAGNGPKEFFYECADCSRRIKEEYEARMRKK